jgi:hypothetical protein
MRELASEYFQNAAICRDLARKLDEVRDRQSPFRGKLAGAVTRKTQRIGYEAGD